MNLRTPGAVHVGVRPETAQQLLITAQAEGFDCHYLDMSSITNENYYATLEREFSFPTPVVSDPGARDWMSDLDWLGEFPGHVVVVGGLEKLLAHHDNIFDRS